VHARCYGELEPVNGVLWLCNLCRPGAPEVSPPCCLCPVTGGAMKPTTDGRWAHLACAMWIPGSSLVFKFLVLITNFKSLTSSPF
ncbi:histone-lysine N-methyltransferase ATX2-like protein, partial [Tanacetum coccineum]